MSNPTEPTPVAPVAPAPVVSLEDFVKSAFASYKSQFSQFSSIAKSSDPKVDKLYEATKLISQIASKMVEDYSKVNPNSIAGSVTGFIVAGQLLEDPRVKAAMTLSDKIWEDLPQATQFLDTPSFDEFLKLLKKQAEDAVKNSGSWCCF